MKRTLTYRQGDAGGAAGSVRVPQRHESCPSPAEIGAHGSDPLENRIPSRERVLDFLSSRVREDADRCTADFVSRMHETDELLEAEVASDRDGRPILHAGTDDLRDTVPQPLLEDILEARSGCLKGLTVIVDEHGRQLYNCRTQGAVVPILVDELKAERLVLHFVLPKSAIVLKGREWVPRRSLVRGVYVLPQKRQEH